METKKTLRLSRNRMVKGVCAGIAEWYGLDANFVRLFYVLTSAACVFVPGILIYVVLWMMMAPPVPE